MNADISAAVALMGHMDLVTVVDSGFPIAREVNRIDISLRSQLHSSSYSNISGSQRKLKAVKRLDPEHLVVVSQELSNMEH